MGISSFNIAACCAFYHPRISLRGRHSKGKGKWGDFECSSSGFSFSHASKIEKRSVTSQKFKFVKLWDWLAYCKLLTISSGLKQLHEGFQEGLKTGGANKQTKNSVSKQATLQCWSNSNQYKLEGGLYWGEGAFNRMDGFLVTGRWAYNWRGGGGGALISGSLRY